MGWLRGACESERASDCLMSMSFVCCSPARSCTSKAPTTTTTPSIHSEEELQ